MHLSHIKKLKQTFYTWVVLIMGFSMPGFVKTAHATEVSSYAFVQEDGSLRIKGRIFHLDGVHIPATDQSCRTFERPVKCSSQAALALDFKIGASFVRCVSRSTNTDGSFNAFCTSNGIDLAAYLLERGWAVALPDAPIEYSTLEKIARNKNLGVWGFAVHRRK